MSRQFVIALILTVAVAACGKSEPKTVTYYLEHPDERKELIKKANENPDKYKDDQDVINAVSAAAKERSKQAMEGWAKKGAREVRPGLGKLH